MEVVSAILIIGVAVFLLIILGLAGWLIGLYNTFVTAVQDIKNQWSNVKTEYQRRADLFMNLVESVKAYTKFEKETLTQVIQARSGNFGKTQAEEMKKLKGLDGVFGRLMVVFERYPKLKAGEQYKDLMNEIRITEDRINIARTDYNSLVRDYNVLIKMFPNNKLAQMFGYTESVFFENEKGTEKAPKIDMKM